MIHFRIAFLSLFEVGFFVRIAKHARGAGAEPLRRIPGNMNTPDNAEALQLIRFLLVTVIPCSLFQSSLGISETFEKLNG